MGMRPFFHGQIPIPIPNPGLNPLGGAPKGLGAAGVKGLKISRLEDPSVWGEEEQIHPFLSLSPLFHQRAPELTGRNPKGDKPTLGPEGRNRGVPNLPPKPLDQGRMGKILVLSPLELSPPAAPP